MLTDSQAREVLAAFASDDPDRLDTVLGHPGCRYRLAFLMGTHHRAGAESPVRKLDLRSISLVFAALELRIPLGSAPSILRESLRAGKWREGMMPVVYPVYRSWTFGSGGTAVGTQTLQHVLMHSMVNIRTYEAHKFDKDEKIVCDLTWLERILDLGNVDNLELCYSKSNFSLYELVFDSLRSDAEAFIAGTEFQEAVITHLEQEGWSGGSRRVRAPRIKRYLDWFGATFPTLSARTEH